MSERIEEATLGASLRHPRFHPGGLRVGKTIHFDPSLHPRDRLGKFRDILAGLAPDQVATLPDGTRVKRIGYVVPRFQVRQGGEVRYVVGAARAAKAVLPEVDPIGLGDKYGLHGEQDSLTRGLLTRLVPGTAPNAPHRSMLLDHLSHPAARERAYQEIERMSGSGEITLGAGGFLRDFVKQAKDSAAQALPRATSRPPSQRLYPPTRHLPGSTERRNANRPKRSMRVPLYEGRFNRDLHPRDRLGKWRLSGNHHDYFTQAKGGAETKLIAVADLVPIHNQPARTESAVRHMQAAKAGKEPKRKPLSVRARPDGRYDVLDGNSTTNALKQHSQITHAPAVVERRAPLG